MPSSSFEKSVKGATKTKVSKSLLLLTTRISWARANNDFVQSQNAAPKSKYIEHILTATYSDAGVAEIFRVLQLRLRDSTWTIVFKSLIVIHMMIREGSPGAALDYLSQNPQRLAITSITDG